MKYNTEIIMAISSPKYLFFWGHQPNRNNEISKSCFSQWWEVAFEEDGICYKSAEHYMMAKKAKLFDDQEILDRILNCNSPAEAKKLGREVKGFSPELWDKKGYNIVKRANLLKFSQNESLNYFLQNTKKRILVEASPVDRIWGIGMASDHKDILFPGKWKGKNLLGYALMEVRDELKKQK